MHTRGVHFLPREACIFSLARRAFPRPVPAGGFTAVRLSIAGHGVPPTVAGRSRNPSTVIPGVAREGPRRRAPRSAFPRVRIVENAARKTRFVRDTLAANVMRCAFCFVFFVFLRSENNGRDTVMGTVTVRCGRNRRGTGMLFGVMRRPGARVTVPDGREPPLQSGDFGKGRGGRAWLRERALCGDWCQGSAGIGFPQAAVRDPDFRGKSGDRKVMGRIPALPVAVGSDYGTGIGRPERLKGAPSGRRPGRMDRKNRLVCRVCGDTGRIIVVSLRGHHSGKWHRPARWRDFFCIVSYGAAAHIIRPRRLL